MITYAYKVKNGNDWAELADGDVPRHVRDEAEIGRHGSGTIEHAGRKYCWREVDPSGLAVRFRRLLEAQGHSISGVAELAGMERQQVHRIVTGKVENPGVATVRRIVEAAGGTLGEFFADQD
jgi:DNA-binding phage protein